MIFFLYLRMHSWGSDHLWLLSSSSQKLRIWHLCKVDLHGWPILQSVIGLVAFVEAHDPFLLPENWRKFQQFQRHRTRLDRCWSRYIMIHLVECSIAGHGTGAKLCPYWKLSLNSSFVTFVSGIDKCPRQSKHKIQNNADLYYCSIVLIWTKYTQQSKGCSSHISVDLISQNSMIYENECKNRDVFGNSTSCT